MLNIVFLRKKPFTFFDDTVTCVTKLHIVSCDTHHKCLNCDRSLSCIIALVIECVIGGLLETISFKVEVGVCAMGPN
jgi:hypothetical protein